MLHVCVVVCRLAVPLTIAVPRWHRRRNPSPSPQTIHPLNLTAPRDVLCPLTQPSRPHFPCDVDELKTTFRPGKFQTKNHSRVPNTSAPKRNVNNNQRPLFTTGITEKVDLGYNLIDGTDAETGGDAIVKRESLCTQTVMIIIILCDLLRCTNEHLNCVFDRSAVCTLNALQPAPAKQLLCVERHTATETGWTPGRSIRRLTPYAQVARPQYRGDTWSTARDLQCERLTQFTA